MNNLQLHRWLQQNKQRVADTIIRNSYAERHEQHSAFFMAGLPGVGKTEYTKNFIKATGLKIVRLDMDEIATMVPEYTPKTADKYRGIASAILSRTVDLTLKRELDFIMDGTFGSQGAVNDLERAVKHGYQVKIIYLFQDPKIAWNFVKAREKI